MIQSMTGFGKADFENENLKIEAEIKSLNSKLFDFKIKIPNLPAEHELGIRNILSKYLTRGKIDCSVKVELKNSKGRFKISEEVFDKYYNQLSELSLKYGKSINDVDFFRVLMPLPETIESYEPEMDEVWSYVYNTVEEAAKKLIEFRIQEGDATKTEFLVSIERIKKCLSEVQLYEQERIDTMRMKLKQTLEENQLNAESERFESEIIYYIEKFDVNEEKSRLANHLKYFTTTIEEEAAGKKLNFISQEMGREINTLGSKANHFEIQKLVVIMKDELEKIKEQVLNVL